MNRVKVNTWLRFIVTTLIASLAIGYCLTSLNTPNFSHHGILKGVFEAAILFSGTILFSLCMADIVPYIKHKGNKMNNLELSPLFLSTSMSMLTIFISVILLTVRLTIMIISMLA